MTELPPGGSAVDRLAPGSRIREWRVERFIARGAFGQVFEATRDSWRDEPSRALKVFDPILSSAARAGLVTEFDLLRDVRHPHLLAGEDAFDIDDGPLAGCVVFVLELADVDLASEVDRCGVLPPGEVAVIGAQLAEGLAALHDGGHLHGDVKPENALRSGGLWKLGDFGVSVALHGSYAHPRGATLDFRPPEVADPGAAGRVHRSADVWALGVTLWMAATGQHPFVGTDAAVRHAAVLRGDRQPAPGIDPALAALVERGCLARDPHARAMAAELAAALRDLAHRLGVTAPPPSTPIPPVGPAAGRGPEAPTVPDRAPAATRRASPPNPPPAPSRADLPGAADLGPTGSVAPAAPGAGQEGAERSSGRAAAVGAVLGGGLAGLVTEVASLVAAAGPGGLVARRAVYGVLVAVALVAALLGARRPLRARVGAPAPAAAVVAAAVVAAIVTAVLFGAP